MMMAAQQAGDSSAMAEAERALLHHWPDSQATWEAIAQFYYPSDPQKAVAAMRRILDLGPSATAHLGLATHSEAIGDTEAALRHYRDALAADSELAHVHWMRGNLQRKLGQQEEALQSYVNALRFARGPLLPMCRESLLRELVSLGHFDRTLSTLGELIMARPELREELREVVGGYFSGDSLRAVLETLDR
jgi:tetratricopeptide (TPR) repeat protein